VGMGPLPALLFFLWLQADHAEEGRKAIEANNFAAAAEHYQKAVDADPKDWASRFHLGLALSFLNKDAEAVTVYRKVLEDKPGLYQAELNLGILLLKQKSADALPLLESAASKEPKKYPPVFYWAEALSQSGDPAKAESAYKAALELQPNSAEASVGLGRLYARQGKLDQADPLYRQAAQSDPEFKRALLELAAHYERAKQSDKAVALYKEFPEDAGARERSGELLLEAGKAADAIPELENAFKQSPTNANRLALAMAYLKAKLPVKGMPLLQQAVAAEPNHYELRMFYGRGLRDQRNFQAAAQEFFKATQLKPDSKEAWNELAAMLISLENYPQGIAALDKAHALGGEENPAYWFFRALALDHLKDYKQAMPAYQKFLSLSEGRHPDEEFKARQRIKVIQKELNKR
jgi:tetratricopeptide (TPR) repeat protein